MDACERSISAVLNDNAVVLADTIVQKVLAPLLTPVISLVLFFVDIYLVLCVVWALIVITGGNLTMLNDTVMSGSLYYKVFNVFNPFV